MTERRLNIRFSAEDYSMLEDLRLLMRTRTDSHTMRVLVRNHHAEMRQEVRRLHRLQKAGP